MVISHILGGLGNQMFQYAAGRALSIARGTSLRLDLSDFQGYKLHQGFELQRIFNCTAQSATDSDVHNILGWQFNPIVRRIVSRPNMALVRRKEFVLEPHFHYWEGINHVPVPGYLKGYWQSERYFVTYSKQIRDDFTFTMPLVDWNAELAEEIAQVNAVSLHVRRGDYVHNPTVHSTHGVCSLDYYRTAIQHISKSVHQPVFFIFSDDINWVKENMQILFPHQFIDHNVGAESYNDMRLMSLCQHQIIANSSFSWWGAWLNNNPNKTVIAPKSWFGNSVNRVTDLYPQSWVTL